MKPFASVEDPDERRALVEQEALAKRAEHWQRERAAGNPDAEAELERLRAEARAWAEGRPRSDEGPEP